MKVVSKRSAHGWSTRLGYILATVGSAVGLGNYWRFPYVVGAHGGGGFIVAYIVLLITAGAPLLFLEMSLGKRFKTSFYQLLKKHRLGMLIVFPLLFGIVVMSYYVVLVGWTLNYALFALTGNLPTLDEYTQSYLTVPMMVTVLIISGSIVALGVRGIERFVKLLIPLMVVLTVIILVYALNLPGGMDGIEFMFTSNFDSLKDLQTWLLAMAQVTFSLSAGVGITLTYASYSKRSNPVVDALAVSLSDLTIALVAGMMIFATVHAFGLNPGEGPELAFVTLPHIFNTMPMGHVIGGTFYFILFIAGITSIIAVVEYLYHNIHTIVGLERRTVVPVIMCLLFVLGLPVALGYTPMNFRCGGHPCLEMYDHYFVNLTVPVVIMLITVLGLLWNTEDFARFLQQYGLGRRTARIVVLWVKTVLPLVAVVMFYQTIKNIL